MDGAAPDDVERPGPPTPDICDAIFVQTGRFHERRAQSKPMPSPHSPASAQSQSHKPAVEGGRFQCEGRKEQLIKPQPCRSSPCVDPDRKFTFRSSKSPLTSLPSKQPDVTWYQFMRCGCKVPRPGNELGKMSSDSLQEFLKVGAVLRTSCVHRFIQPWENTAELWTSLLGAAQMWAKAKRWQWGSKSHLW